MPRDSYKPIAKPAAQPIDKPKDVPPLKRHGTVKNTVRLKFCNSKYMEIETGEVIDATTVIKNVEQDVGWHKVWLADLAMTMGMFNYSKVNVLSWILKNVNYQNYVIGTTEQIARETGVSRVTVSQTLKLMERHNLITRRRRTPGGKACGGVLEVNPSIIVRGGSKKRGTLIVRYEETKKTGDPSGSPHHAESAPAENEAAA